MQNGGNARTGYPRSIIQINSRIEDLDMHYAATSATIANIQHAVL